VVGTVAVEHLFEKLPELGKGEGREQEWSQEKMNYTQNKVKLHKDTYWDKKLPRNNANNVDASVADCGRGGNRGNTGTKTALTQFPHANN